MNQRLLLLFIGLLLFALTAQVVDQYKAPMSGAAVTWTSGDDAWISSDTGVATVDDEGLVTAVGSGDARITATQTDLSATVPIEVEIANPDRATLITLFNALDGPNWMRNTNWLSDLPLGAWHGVAMSFYRVLCRSKSSASINFSH